MPIYEYWCPECRDTFEKLRPMNSKDSEVSCPACGSQVKRMVSVVAIAGRTSESSGFASQAGGGCGCGGNCGCGGHHRN